MKSARSLKQPRAAPSGRIRSGGAAAERTRLAGRRREQAGAPRPCSRARNVFLGAVPKPLPATSLVFIAPASLAKAGHRTTPRTQSGGAGVAQSRVPARRGRSACHTLGTYSDCPVAKLCALQGLQGVKLTHSRLRSSRRRDAR